MAARQLIKFIRKSPRDKIRAVVATVRHHCHQLYIRRILRGRRAVPRVIEGKSEFYLAFRPDSDILHGVHPELRDLARKWVTNNLDPNAGDLPRLFSLLLNIKQVLAEGTEGDFAELGVYRGNSAAVLAHFARSHNRTLYLFDTFAGFDLRDMQGVDSPKEMQFHDTSLAAVQNFVGQEAVTYVQGFFPQSIPANLANKKFSVVHLDCDLYEPTRAGLEFFYPRLSPGGLLIVHDYSGVYWDGVKRAVDEFMATIPERLVLWPDKSGTAVIRRTQRPG